MRSQIAGILSQKSGEIYQKCLALVAYTTPHEFVGRLYDVYRRAYKSNSSINGRIFELAICETLAQEKITPFYYQARFERVPNADFDVVLYDAAKPVVLTMKTSLRERYKQADLEGLALQNVYRQAQSYLITLDESEAGNVEDKIKRGDIAGLKKCVVANQPAYSELLQELSACSFCVAEAVMPISGKFLPG